MLALPRQETPFGEISQFHEAFAGTVCATFKALENAGLGIIDRDRVNVNGSSLAAGHPFAATGGRIVAQTAKLLAEHQREHGTPARALITVCAAGGLGVTAILESVPAEGGN